MTHSCERSLTAAAAAVARRGRLRALREMKGNPALQSPSLKSGNKYFFDWFFRDPGGKPLLFNLSLRYLATLAPATLLRATGPHWAPHTAGGDEGVLGPWGYVRHLGEASVTLRAL